MFDLPKQGLEINRGASGLSQGRTLSLGGAFRGVVCLTASGPVDAPPFLLVYLYITCSAALQMHSKSLLKGCRGKNTLCGALGNLDPHYTACLELVSPYRMY